MNPLLFFSKAKIEESVTSEVNAKVKTWLSINRREDGKLTPLENLHRESLVSRYADESFQFRIYVTIGVFFTLLGFWDGSGHNRVSSVFFLSLVGPFLISHFYIPKNISTCTVVSCLEEMETTIIARSIFRRACLVFWLVNTGTLSIYT